MVPRHNVAAAGLEDVVIVHRSRAHEKAWEEPIGRLFVEALYDYDSVARVVAYYDCGAYFPGVQAFVEELPAAPEFELLDAADMLVSLAVNRWLRRLVRRAG